MVYRTDETVFQKRYKTKTFHPSKTDNSIKYTIQSCYHLHPQASLIHFSILTFNPCIPTTQGCCIICSGLGRLSNSFSKLSSARPCKGEANHLLRKCLNAALHFKFFSGSSSRSCAISVTSRYCTKSIIERGGCPGGGNGKRAWATSINDIPNDHKSDRMLY